MAGILDKPDQTDHGMRLPQPIKVEDSLERWHMRFPRGLLQVISWWITPRAVHQDERFQERNIRVVTLLGGIFYSVLLLFGLVAGHGSVSWPLYIAIAVFIILAVSALHIKNTQLAAWVIALAPSTILLDNSASYWSPGTVTMNILFSYILLLVMPRSRRLVIAIFFNFGIYVFLVLSANQPSPLEYGDFYAEPILAVIATLLGHLLILGMGLYIRHDQLERDEQRLNIVRERNAFLNMLFQHLSHDFKTPLSSIKASGYLLNRMATDKQELVLKRINEDITRLEKIVQDVLEITKLDVGSNLCFHELDLNAVIRTTVRQLDDQIRAQAQHVALHLSPDSCIVQADHTYFQRALTHLLENAAFYTPHNGNIDISTTCDKGLVTLAIRNSGVVISEDVLPHIFDYFYRADQSRNSDLGHTGMGLALTRRILEIHHGSIEVLSSEQEGTTVLVHIPLES